MSDATPSATVGANVRAELARRGLPQRALAEHLQLSQVSVSARLRGVTPFDVNELHSVAAFLGVPVSILLTGAVEAKAS